MRPVTKKKRKREKCIASMDAPFQPDCPYISSPSLLLLFRWGGGGAYLCFCFRQGEAIKPPETDTCITLFPTLAYTLHLDKKKAQHISSIFFFFFFFPPPLSMLSSCSGVFRQSGEEKKKKQAADHAAIAIGIVQRTAHREEVEIGVLQC